MTLSIYFVWRGHGCGRDLQLILTEIREEINFLVLDMNFVVIKETMMRDEINDEIWCYLYYHVYLSIQSNNNTTGSRLIYNMLFQQVQLA